MLNGIDEAEVDKTVEYLADYNFHLQHNTRLSIDDLKQNTSLVISALEEDQKLQEAVLSLYHCYQISAASSNCAKIIENHNSIKFIKNHKINQGGFKMTSLNIKNDECTLEAIDLFNIIGIMNDEKLSIEEIAAQYNEAIQSFEKKNIDDSVFYYAR